MFYFTCNHGLTKLGLLVNNYRWNFFVPASNLWSRHCCQNERWNNYESPQRRNSLRPVYVELLACVFQCDLAAIVKLSYSACRTISFLFSHLLLHIQWHQSIFIFFWGEAKFYLAANWHRLTHISCSARTNVFRPTETTVLYSTAQVTVHVCI